ncbi:MAG: emp24/gp25L/p24 family protein [Chloroflexi bacterium]|nr:emp24/gp25L/p24 family protein [Chloroflexota bacterium]
MPSLSQPYETLISICRSIGSLARSLYSVPKGKTITGAIIVRGNDQQDIGFSIWSPTNRIILFEEDRAHELEFEVVGTIRGDYRFEFDNRHSAFTEKKFTVTVCVT